MIIKFLIELQNSQKIYHRLIQKQLQMKKKYLYIFPEKIPKIINDLRLIEQYDNIKK